MGLRYVHWLLTFYALHDSLIISLVHFTKQLKQFGQQGVQGRYPIHTHMLESVEGTRIEKNVINRSNQRCIVIHGTHNATIFDNVAFFTKGHCFMVRLQAIL